MQHTIATQVQISINWATLINYPNCSTNSMVPLCIVLEKKSFITHPINACTSLGRESSHSIKYDLNNASLNIVSAVGGTIKKLKKIDLLSPNIHTHTYVHCNFQISKTFLKRTSWKILIKCQTISLWCSYTSHSLFFCWCMDTVRRKLMLVILTCVGLKVLTPATADTSQEGQFLNWIDKYPFSISVLFYASCNVSNMRRSVSSPDETPRREWNTVSNVWYFFSNKIIFEREIKDAKMSSFPSDIQTLIKH